MKDVITKERTFNRSIQTVWNAISKAEELSAWFINADFKAEKGYNYRFTSSGENCTAIIGEILEADPYTLSYTWIVEGTKAVTTVTWRLESEGENTKLYLEHSGISNYEGETAVTMFNNFNGGWDNCMSELNTYLKQEAHAG